MKLLCFGKGAKLYLNDYVRNGRMTSHYGMKLADSLR